MIDLWRFSAIGTEWAVETDVPLTGDDRDAVSALIDAFDRDWSRFRADSLVTDLALRPGTREAPPDATAMLDLSARMSRATHGAVNPLVGDSLAHRGYDAACTLEDRGPLAAPADWQSMLTWNEHELALAVPAMIDVGALGKGRLVDVVLAAIAARTPGGVVVDASGDIAVHGRRERIGLEHPFDARRAIGVWEVADAALCASATNRRAWGDGLHHVLDARTGEPVRTIAASWAVASDAMTADAIATALFFDGGAEFARDCGAEWVRMTSDGRVEWSTGCGAELFS